MMDKMLAGTLNTLIVTLITALSGASLVCAHSGVLSFCGGSNAAGFTLLGAGAALAIGAAFIIRYRNDLVDR